MLSLPTPNAEPERVFHLQKLNKKALRNKLSTNPTDSVLLVRSKLTHSKLTVENWNRDKEMLKLFNKYKELYIIII